MRRRLQIRRIMAWLVIAATVCGAALGLVPAAVADDVPNLTVHVTSGTPGSGSPNNDGDAVALPQNQHPEPAGTGFIYRLIQLDDDVVEAVVADTDEERITKVLADLADSDKRDSYLKVDDSGNLTTVFGITDAAGEITARGDTGAGSWVAGGTITSDGQLVASDNHELTPYQFIDSAAFPTQWLLELVYHPAGLSVQASAPGLIELPFIDDDLNANYDVHVYPKTQACTGPDMPGGPVVVAAAYRSSGGRVGTAAFEPCETADITTPTPPMKEPTIVDKVNEMARTGSNIAWIALSMLALSMLALFMLVARRRSQRNREDTGLAAPATTQSATRSWGSNER